MKYQEIREAFPKCGVLVSKEGISLVFQQYPKPQFIGEDVDDDEMLNRGVLVELLENSDGIRVALAPGLGNRLDFLIDLPAGNDIMFPPMRRQLSFAEIDEIVKKQSMGPSQDFVDVFSKVDLSDEASVLAGVSEVIRRGKHGEVLQVDVLRNWPDIKAAAQDFYNKIRFGSLALEGPDQWVSNGSAIFDFESEKPRVFELRKDDLPGFIKLVRIANWLSLESFSSDERANFVISFYS